MRELTFIQFLEPHPNPMDVHDPTIGTMYLVFDFEGDYSREWQDDDGDWQEEELQALIVGEPDGPGYWKTRIVDDTDLVYNKFIIELDEDCPLFKEAI